MGKNFTLTLFTTFLFFIMGARAQSIWPGDMNNNGVTNNVDVLYWAIAHGKTGAARASVGTNWQAYAMPAAWSGAFPGTGGPNFAYADANGDGKVDKKDVEEAVSTNYAKTRGTPTPDEYSPTSTTSAIRIYAKEPTGDLTPGQPVTVQIHGGRINHGTIKLYGLAFTIKYNPNLVAENGIQFAANSRFESDQNMYILTKDVRSKGELQVAITRFNQLTRDWLDGLIGQLTLQLRNNNATLQLDITNIKLIDNNMAHYPVLGEGTKIVIGNGGGDDDDDDDDDDDHSDNPCPQVIEPVCGADGKVYLNSCYAEKAGVAYTPGVCNTDCVDPTRIKPNTVCEQSYQPVCGCNGETYSNPCEAEKAGVRAYTSGPCAANNYCYDPNYVITASYTEINASNGTIIFTVPQNNDPVCGCNGITYKNSYAAEANGITQYTKGKCSADCVDPSKINPSVECPAVYDPVCGCNNVTYTNECVAKAAGVVSFTKGICNGGNNSAWCNKATPLECGNFLSGESTANAGNHINQYPCSAKSYTGPEKVYIINKTSAGDLQIGLEILTANLDLDLFLLAPNCNQLTCLKSSTTNNTQTNNEGIVVEDAPVGTYYLVVDGPAAGQFRLELSCGYLFCGDATPLTCGVTYNGNNHDGHDNVSLYGCSGGIYNVENNGPEKIHYFTLTQEGEVSIALTGLSANLELFLLKDCDRGSCLEFSQNGGTSNEAINTTLPAGTYYIVVDGYNGATSNYKLTVDCASASCNLNATLTPTNANCGQNNGSFLVHTTGGNPTYIISWDGPVSGTRNTQSNNTTIEKLPAGSYEVTIVDKFGCAVHKKVTIGSDGNIGIQTSVTNAACGQLGKVKINLSNGAAPFKIYLSGTANHTFTADGSTITLENLQPGAYHIYVVDKNGCTVSKDIVIGQEEGNFSFTATATAAACENPGSISIKTLNGSKPYKIQVTGPKSGSQTVNADNFSIQNLPGGTYTIKIEDASGCSYTLTVTVPTTELIATISTIEGTCAQPGAIKVNITSGKPNFMISWDGPGSNDGTQTTGSTSYTIPNLPAGSYTVTIKDGNWCSIMKVVSVHSASSDLDFVLVPQKGVCESPGKIGVDISGGQAPYKVTWDGPGSNDGSTTTSENWLDIANLAPGSYTVTIKDNQGCSVTKTTQLLAPESNLSLQLSVTEGNCGQSSSVWVDVDGGTPVYKITWQGPTNGSAESNSDKFEIKNLAAGTYTIKVMDGNWCVVSKTVVVNGSTGFDLTLTPKKGICETPGSIRVDINGGKAPYKITWDGPGSNDGNTTSNTNWLDINDLPAGTYTITVKDDKGCTVIKTTQIQVTESNLGLQVSATEGNCGQPSSIWVTISGGTPVYKITWDGPVDGEATTSNDKFEIKNLAAGSYVVKIFDKNWCAISKTIVLTGGAPGFDFTLTPVNAVCESPGIVKVVINGGKAPYKITWDGPGSNDGSTSTSETALEIVNLPSGSYTVTIKDGNGCEFKKTVQVSKLENTLSLKTTVTEGNCGQSSTILVDVDGGQPIYKISWDGPIDGEADTNTDKFEIKNLPAGSYLIKVFDKNWCAISKTIVLTGGAPGFDFTLTPVNAVCESPGIVKVVINGGKAPYKITWDGPGSNDGSTSTSETALEIVNMPSGSYTVTIKDGNGCEFKKTVQVSKLENTLSLKTTVTEGNCGQSSTILVDVDGGQPIYKISWDGPIDGEVDTNTDKFEIKNLPAGSYLIKVFDKNWCAISKTVVVTGGSPGFDFTLTPVNAVCESPGIVKVVINGGKAPYKISWDGPGSNDGSTSTSETALEIVNLPSGSYTVTIKDGNGCEFKKTVQVSKLENTLSLKTTVTEGNCGQPSTILVDVDGGQPIYKISWDGPVDGEVDTNTDKFEIKNLPAGSYLIKVFDKNWCAISKTVVVTGGSPGFEVKLTPTNGVCETPGGIQVKIEGGKAPYKITWDGPGSNDGSASTSANTFDITNLPPGSYTVTVKDNNGCTISKSTQVSTTESNLSLTVTPSPDACGPTGKIALYITGGTRAYKVSWEGPSSGSATVDNNNFEIKNLIPGSYKIVVMDQNWCSVTKNVTINAGTQNLFNATATNGVCETPGSIKLNLISGSAPYTITWTGSSSPVTTTGSVYTINNVAPGHYTIKVKDARGCEETETVTIHAAESHLDVDATLLTGSCGELSKVKISISGGAPKYKIEWSGPQNGSTQSNATHLELSNLPAGHYTFKVTDANWCVASISITVHHPTGELFKTKPINGVCESLGAIRLTFLGGRPVYNISWNGPTPGAGSTSDSVFVIQNLSPGNYSIKVTDKNGCTETETVVLGQVEESIDFDASLIVNDCGQYNTIWIDINNGVPTYTIKWDGPGNQDGSGTTPIGKFEIPNLLPGKYTVTIFDNNWCYADTTITIHNAPIDIFSATETDGACNQTGSIKLNFTGTPNYQVKWDGPVDSTVTVNNNSYTITNLPAGTYILTVTDAKGCSEKDTIAISGGNLVAKIVSKNGNCADEGKIEVDITAGTGPFSIIVKGASFNDTIQVPQLGEVVVTDLASGVYTVTVRSAGGCSIVKEVSITVTESFLDLSTSTSPVTCSGAGSATVQISGGEAPFIITWVGLGSTQSDTISNRTFTIPNLQAGNYSVTVKDEAACAVTKSFKINSNKNSLEVGTTVTNGTCGQAGQILVSAMGGTAPFKYQWSGPSSGTQNSATATYTIPNLATGTYSITVTDAGGCTKTRTATVTNSGQAVVAGFTFTVDGAQVTFSNQSSEGTYLWTFGDQTTSTQKNPTHTYQISDTFNVCLKVTTNCGTKEICKTVIIAPQAEVVNIDVEDGTAGKGEIIYIPVVIENCVTNALVSFAGSLQIDNTNIAVITGIQPGSISPQYFANNQTFSFYSFSGNGVPCGEGQILFYVGVELKGNPGTSTVLRIVSTPLAVEVGGLRNGTPVTIPHAVTSGLVSVASVAVLQGEVTTYWGDPLPSVEVDIKNTAYNKKDTTNNAGHYDVAQLPLGKEYMIQPKHDADPSNGLSTYALFAGQRFILGMQPEEIISPYQVIAGDANCDGRFSTLDLFIIQRLIIGVSDDFDNCPSWVFVRAGDQMPIEFDATNVFPYHNCDTLMLMKDTVSNFIGVKVGDILGHANPALHNIEPRGLDMLRLLAQNRAVKAGEVFELTLTSENFHQIASYQMGLSFDFNQLEFVELVTNVHSPLAKIALNDQRAKEGLLRLSWFDPSGRGISTKAEDQVLTLRFRALTDIANLANLLEISSRALRSEAYTTSAERMNVALQFINAPLVEPNEQVAVGYKLYQNVPNPFNQQTIIGFDLPQAMQADLVVFDQLGRVVKTFNGMYNKGYNQVEMPRSELNAGVYHYTLRTGDFAQTKSMIIFE